MKATKLYRIASLLLFLFAAGNIYGTSRFWWIARSMNPVRFPWGHSGFSYAQVVLGFEGFSTLCVVFAGYLAWHLGALARTTPQAIGALGWLLFAYGLVGVYISWIALSGFVLILSAVITISIGWATVQATGARRALAAAS